MHIYDLKVKLGELENHRFTNFYIKQKCVQFHLFDIFCSLPAFSSKPLKMIIGDNRRDRVNKVNLRICAILKSNAIQYNPELDAES